MKNLVPVLISTTLILSGSGKQFLISANDLDYTSTDSQISGTGSSHIGVRTGAATVHSGGASVNSGGASVNSGGASVNSGGASVNSGGAGVNSKGAGVNSGGKTKVTLEGNGYIKTDENGGIKEIGTKGKGKAEVSGGANIGVINGRK